MNILESQQSLDYHLVIPRLLIILLQILFPKERNIYLEIVFLFVNWLLQVDLEANISWLILFLWLEYKL